MPTFTVPSRLQSFLHWFMAAAGLFLSARQDLPAALAFLPGDSKASKYVGWGLALAAFTRILGARAGIIPAAEVPTPAAPSNVIPLSEAITAVDKPGAVQKDK